MTKIAGIEQFLVGEFVAGVREVVLGKVREK
jgi:hypothetical protein